MVESTRAKAKDAIFLTYDLAWNQIGRPKYDMRFSLLFPGGPSHYMAGDADKLPERMEFLAQLLEKGIHPKLSGEHTAAAAEVVRAAAKVHRDALVAARGPTSWRMK